MKTIYIFLFPFFFLILLLFTTNSFGQRCDKKNYCDKANIEDYDYFSQSTTTSNENTPKTFTMQDVSSWQPTAQIIQGSGDVKINFWNGSKRKYR
jgi:hypothetical protein